MSFSKFCSCQLPSCTKQIACIYLHEKTNTTEAEFKMTLWSEIAKPQQIHFEPGVTTLSNIILNIN